MKKALFIILLLSNWLVHTALAQNLVLNGSFEHHNVPLKHACFRSKEEVSQTLKAWHTESESACELSLFTKNYKPTTDEREYVGYHFEQCQPHTGHSMMRIEVHPTGGRWNDKGSSGYLQAKLQTPLEVGEIYAVEYYVFFALSDLGLARPDFISHFGLDLLQGNLRLPDKEGVAISNTFLPIDSIVTGQWHRVTYHIKPTQPYTALSIGAYFNPANAYSFTEGGGAYYFFIDDVSIEKITSTTAKMAIHDFPNPQNTLSLETEIDQNITCRLCERTLYFEKNLHRIQYNAIPYLDSLSEYLMKHTNMMLSLNGYTDPTGSDIENSALSKARASEVRDYLIRKGIAAFRLEAAWFGSDSAHSIQSNEQQLALDRKVVIKPSETTTHQKLYLSAIKFVKFNQNDSAILCLNELLNYNFDEPMMILHDPEFDDIKHDPAWQQIIKKIETSYQINKLPTLSFQLDDLYYKDQRFRSIGDFHQAIKGYDPFESVEKVDDIQIQQDSLNLMALLDLLHFPHLPKAELVGKRQASTPFLIIQHSGNLPIMKKYLPIFYQSYESGDLPGSMYASMYDRITLKESGKQKYGTQYVVAENDPNKLIVAPLENKELVDCHRRSLGMPPVTTWVLWLEK
jgi:outer membrane protein OmpA-like peptidoglycan-associated protein